MQEHGDWMAIGILLALAAAVIARIVLVFVRTRLTPWQQFFYWFNFSVARFLWRAEIRGQLPPIGSEGAIIVCNHTSSIDPAFVQLAAGKRVVHWMVAAEYFKNPGFGFFLNVVQAIPVNRGGVDTAATRLGMRYLKRGDLIGMFPEGRINVSGNLLLPGRPGAALIALKVRCPVIPCYISGVPYDGSVLGSFRMPGRVKLVIGPAMDLSPYYGREREEGVLVELTKRFLSEIARLAGQPDYPVQVAGRRWMPAKEEAAASTASS